MIKTCQDCIFCGNPTGSAEHLTLAGLGGLSTNKGILCKPCNEGFSVIDAMLVEDMRALNAIVGARNSRTKKPAEIPLDDLATGRTYRLRKGHEIRHPKPLIFEDRLVDGIRHVSAIVSNEQQKGEFLHQLKADGKLVRITSQKRIPLLFARTPTVAWDFGSIDTLRAVARLALNIFAHHFPDRVRERWLDDFKRFIREGGATEPWVDFEYAEHADERIPLDTFPFQHRFLLGFDAGPGVVYARVSLLGVIDMSVRFGTTTIERSETLIHDVNVVETNAPHDLRVQLIAGAALAPPIAATEDPSPFVVQRLAILLEKRTDWIWEQDAPELVAALNNARTMEAFEQYEQIIEALAGQTQRLLTLAALVADDIRRHLTAQFGDDGASIADAFGHFAEPDAKDRAGVTRFTRVYMEQMRYMMADHLLQILEQREVEAAELRLLFEGGPGVAMIGMAMLEEIQKADPLLRIT